MKKNNIDQTIEQIIRIQTELSRVLDVAELRTRNPIANKWKECFRVCNLKDVVSWRFADLIYQAALLQKGNHVLGAGILLRASIETLAILIYTNMQMEKTICSHRSFWKSSDETMKLLFGSKDGFTGFEAINVLNIIDKCDKVRDYRLRKKYDHLSESTHPNWDGTQKLYAKLDRENHIVYFDNYALHHFQSNLALLNLLIGIFTREYNEIWPNNFVKFEKWVEENDERLEEEMNQN